MGKTNNRGGVMDIEQMKKELAELRAYKEAAESQKPTHIIDWEFDDDPDDADARGDLIVHKLNGAEYPAGTPLYAKPMPADNPERITEQDAREILGAYWDSSDDCGDWLKSVDGRALLNKLNADREQVSAVAVPENLRQWYIDLTNSDQVHDDGEISGYCCSTEMLSRLERIIAPSHSQQSAEQISGWQIALKVREALDRRACPDAFMRVAVEEIERLLCPSHESDQP